MSITLYYRPRTRAGRVRWLLEELGVPYELRREGTVHPLGLWPALEVDGVPMMESAAMLIYLADRFADRGLAPALDAPDRATYLQWILFNATTLEPPLLEAHFPTRGTPTPEAKARAIASFDAAARVVAAPLADGRAFLLGAQLTAADVAIGSVLAWARAGGALDAHPTLVEYGRRLGARPASKAARAD